MALFRRKGKGADTSPDDIEVSSTDDVADAQDSGDAAAAEDADSADTSSDEHGRDTDTADADTADAEDTAEQDDVEADQDAEDTVDQNDDTVEQDDEAEGRIARPYDLDRSEGPFDRSEVDDLEDRMDFGALVIIPESAMELRLDVDDAGQEITGMTVVQGESACQLQAFAAPKSRGVWDEIRDEIADNLIGGGGTAQEKLGPLGIELHARMPSRGSDGRTTYAPARFLGVDGPRWFLRAVLSGAAAVDEDAAQSLLAFIRRTVVVRGTEARAPREMLALSIPHDVTATAQQAAQQDNQETADDFKPFERGPEITEVR